MMHFGSLSCSLLLFAAHIFAAFFLAVLLIICRSLLGSAAHIFDAFFLAFVVLLTILQTNLM